MHNNTGENFILGKVNAEELLCFYWRKGKHFFCVSVDGATSKQKAVREQAVVVLIFLRNYLEITEILN